MSAPVDMTALAEKTVHIQAVHHVRAWRLRIEFSDGEISEVDFEPFLRHSQHPAIQAYLDLAKFKSYRLEHGDLLWGDYDLCFPMADLYDGVIR